jgi:phospholipid/cholesterol/gamma-HCH transport system substrate-binding protein
MSRALTRLQALLLGMVICLALALAGTGLFAVGDRDFLWNRTFQVEAGFGEVRGLEVGTPVRIQGITAGKVASVEAPASPGDPVVLRLRIDNRYRSLVRSDAVVQIVGEGLIGGKVVEIGPGSSGAGPVQDNARLATRPPAELSDLLGRVDSAINELGKAQGTVARLMHDPQAYDKVVAALQQTHDTLAAVQQDAEALKRLPVVRGYVEDPQALLVRPDCERNRQCFAEADLFELGRAVLTEDGRHRLDDLGPWFAGLKQKGSEVVVVAYADPRITAPGVARPLTARQSEVVCDYLKAHHSVQKLGWFSSRKVVPLGLGTSAPLVPETENLPPARVEIIVFVPQG